MPITLPHHCNGCANRWNGYETCHCAACHLTFSTIANFDRHRRNEKCLSPVAAGLVQSGRTYECWGRPFSLTGGGFERVSGAPEGDDMQEAA